MTDLLASLSVAGDYDPNSLAVDKARALILSLMAPLPGTERLFIRDALGRVLAEDVISPIDVPGHDNSAMDGYALRHADLHGTGETRLRVVGTALAGRAFAGEIGPGQCLRIMTGAVVPASLDTIVIQEVVKVEGDEILVPPGQKRGQNLRRAGEDLRAGQPAVAAGARIRPAELGLVASLGVAEVAVHRRPRVALFSTGDELVSLGETPGPGQIYDSNRYSLWGLLRRLDCDILDLGVVPDQPTLLEAALARASTEADVIITSGGVSVGEADFIKGLMTRMGEVAFWKIAMKPGRPMAFGKIGPAWLFGLPGNPVAVMVTFYQFVRPALMALAGQRPAPLPDFQVRLASPLRKHRGRTEFVRGLLFHDGATWAVRPTGAQGSGILRSMADANCFIVLEPERGDVAADESVTVQPMEGLV